MAKLTNQLGHKVTATKSASPDAVDTTATIKTKKKRKKVTENDKRIKSVRLNVKTSANLMTLAKINGYRSVASYLDDLSKDLIENLPKDQKDRFDVVHSIVVNTRL